MSKSNVKSTVEGGKRRIKMPNVFTILLGIIILAGILTYIVPAGEFARVEIDGRTVINPEEFTYIESTPVSPFDWFVAIPQGVAASAIIMATIFIPVGAIAVYTETGAFQAGIASMLKKFGQKGSIYVILGLMTFFTLRAGLEGAVDTHLAFVPLTIAFALSAGYDVMTGVAITMVTTFVSFAVGITNPYTVVIAQDIAGLPIYSGLGLRTINWLVMMGVTWHHILRYAKRVKDNPKLSITKDIDTSAFATIDIEEFANKPLTKKQKLLLTMLILTIGTCITGAFKWGFALPQFIGVFLISGIAAGIIAGFDNHKIADIFMKNGSKVYFGAMCVAVARAIQIVLEKGNITDTIIYYLSLPLKELPPFLSALGMYVVQLLINFFVPSGSGQAMVTMPITAPLADIIGMTRQTAVMAFQLGDGITNLIFPTMGLIFAYIGFGNISYEKYVKYIIPLVWKLIVIGSITLFIATLINYGPF